jgi:hypothetical protein
MNHVANHSPITRKSRRQSLPLVHHSPAAKVPGPGRHVCSVRQLRGYVRSHVTQMGCGLSDVRSKRRRLGNGCPAFESGLTRLQIIVECQNPPLQPLMSVIRACLPSLL